MKSGGLWNLRGLRPESVAAACEAARQSGVSVGEWLNELIEQSDDYGHASPRLMERITGRPTRRHRMITAVALGPARHGAITNTTMTEPRGGIPPRRANNSARSMPGSII